MQSKVLLPMVVAAAFGLSGCVVAVGGDGWESDSWDSDSSSHWKKLETENRKKLSQLSPGMSVDQVVALLGTAEFNEFYRQDDKDVQVLFYRTHRTKGDGKTTKEECTAVVLEQGKVVGWGDKAYQNAI
ncbi:Outer membrane protein assembly factor BamE, lipoprotein component of the BamABCDE complex [Ferrimonas sediminum]|uniref:Outer membrane protein assembly factor BamE, lipoprotein component of the BamABCDE complex n=1 Tax=Ferrimonas sediminum TaxID=718193 RepID=A0A1G8LNI8_9GAMM|nr:DUF3192 domain-containing protein [Ferrimonas sediminum]SDI57203.1 Outer membrane protein assembly factor BamE, lipoprotein component of the BamABCDE complex [Ferrimonas sediminum]